MNFLKINSSILAALLCIFIVPTVFAQASLFSYETYTNTTGDSLNYRFLTCDYDNASKYPLVIFLHGSGERGSDNEAQLKWGVKNFASDDIMKVYRPIVIAPQCPENLSWGNFSKDTSALLPNPSKPMQLLMELIKQTIKEYPVDTNRIYITGLSMGGFGTYDALSRYPDVFAAAVPVCGAGDISKANVFAHVPIWIFHGALDPVVAPDNSLKMVEALTKAGAHPGYTQYPKAGHFSWIAAYSDDLMMEWLFSQHK